MRDIVLIIGPFASGKTFTINYLQKKAAERGVLYEKEIFSDAQTILENMEKDDAEGGFYHYHPWCVGVIDGHTHHNGEPKLPMVVYGNKILDAMYRDLFYKLENLPYTGKLWFVEFAGGVNTNVAEKLEYQINYSLTRLGKMLEKKAFPHTWLNRVQTVIHPRTEFETRVALNKKKKSTQQSEIEKGLASAFNVKAMMQVTGKDDFAGIVKVFQAAKVVQIYDIENTANHGYEKSLDTISRDIFSPFQLDTTRKKHIRKDIVLFVGRNCSGKKTLLQQFYKLGKKYRYPHHSRFISDYEFFVKKVREDDTKGGFNHYHPWCKNNQGGHTHSTGEKEVPFIMTNNLLVEESFGEFFMNLSNLPQTGEVWFVDWSGGINVNPSYESASQLDFSFERAGAFFKKGMYPTDWLERVSSVIHPFAEDSVRNELDEQESIRELEKIKNDSVSPGEKSKTLIDMYGKDDFYTIEKFFHESHVSQMHHFEFENKTQLLLYAENIGNMLFNH